MLTLTNTKTKDKLMLTHFTVELVDKFSNALGKIPGRRNYSCDDAAATIWPLHLSVNIKGTMDMAKEGRLLVALSGSCTYEKTGVVQMGMRGFKVDLERMSTSQTLGGFVMHEAISALVREKEASLHKPILAALVTAISDIKKEEERLSSAHAARARVAGTILTTVKKG